jgi:hypothetical protein
MAVADRRRRYKRQQKLGLDLIGPVEAEANALSLWLEREGVLDPEDCTNDGLTRALQRLVDRATASLG